MQVSSELWSFFPTINLNCYDKNMQAQIELYLQGHLKVFTYPPNFWLQFPTFQKLVLQACATIPYGSTVTYGQLAEKIGSPKAARAVGNAIHNNPFPLYIPCHRVVNTNQIGQYLGGVTIKSSLLQWEKLTISYPRVYPHPFNLQQANALYDFYAIYQLLQQKIPTLSESNPNWWPGDSSFEIAVGAVLTQNTAWRNVEKSISNLKNQKILSPLSLHHTSIEKIIPLISPSGCMHTKANYIKNLSQWWISTHHIANTYPTSCLRDSLLTVNGIGPETADDILLYVYNRPLFIWDLYARRLLKTIGYIFPNNYEGARKALEKYATLSHLSLTDYKQFHGLIVEGGKLASSQGGWEKWLLTECC